MHFGIPCAFLGLLATVLVCDPATARSLQKGKEYTFANAVYCYTREAVNALVKLRRDAVYGQVPPGCEIGSLSKFVPEYRVPLVSFPTVAVIPSPEKGDVPCTNKQTLEIRFCRTIMRGMVAGYATRNDDQILLLYLEVSDDIEVQAVEQLDGGTP